jgi:chemotaxis protein methyltransferase CheR
LTIHSPIRTFLVDEKGRLFFLYLYVTSERKKNLDELKKGRFPRARLPEFEQFYLQSGGKRRFSEYGILEGTVFTFEDRIRSSLAFFQYHIATDASFNLFQAILSRRSFARRPQEIRERVYRVFDESLCSLGVLGLGKRDTLTGSTLERRYRRLDGKNAL